MAEDIERAPGLRAWIRDYHRIRPTSATERIALYSAVLRAALAYSMNPGGFTSVGHYLRRTIVVRPFGLSIEVRPRTDDLSLATEGHKPALVRWFQPRPGDYVVDVGAHLGLYSLWAARQGAEVLAIEPNPSTYERLARNIVANRPLAVEARNLAAGGEFREATLYDPASRSGVSSLLQTWSGRFAERADQEIRVPVVPLDRLLPYPPGRGIDWLLIDVEGYEAEVLRGARECLGRTRQVILEVTHGATECDCAQLLRDRGFRVVRSERQNPVNSYWLCERTESACSPIDRSSGTG